MAHRQHHRFKQTTPPAVLRDDAAQPDAPSPVQEDEPALAADINVLSDSLVGESRGVSREQKIEQVAYRLAEQRGFAPGHELEDWLHAERQVDTELSNAGILNRETIPW